MKGRNWTVKERLRLLESIATTTMDYRAGDLEPPTPEHVATWVNQFSVDVQLPILREMDNVLKKTYFSLNMVSKFLASGVLQGNKLVGPDPCDFWKSVRFLDIQGGGNSQREMLVLFGQLIEKTCGIKIEECGQKPHAYIYLDDAIFTGTRVLFDLRNWIKFDAPAKATVHVVSMAQHHGGWYYAKKELQQTAKLVGKSINISGWSALKLEDRRTYTNISDVLRPISIPNDPEVQDYVNSMVHKPHFRTPGSVSTNKLFTNEEGRNLLEQEFLKAGVKIRKLCPYLIEKQRPLGHINLETLGFGSLIVTFRNCPNNAPLALWAGDPWYPLFPRTTNSATALKRFWDTSTSGKFDNF
jgi:hypothetical protein